jgi:ribonuclease P protein component
VRDGLSLPVFKRYLPSFALMERLRRRMDFRAAARAMRTPGSAFVLQARRRQDQGGVRVGFTVSRQVGNAVERNRVRRRLRELVRLATAGSLHPGHDYVLIGRRAVLNLPFGDMMTELAAALTRIHAFEAQGAGSPGKLPLHEAGSPGLKPPMPRPKPRSKAAPKSADAEH